MDTHNDTTMATDQVRAETAGFKMVVGAKQLRKALQNGKARRVYLARNADPAITEPLEEMCGKRNIQIAWVPTMAELGLMCGIEVGAAAASVVDP